LSVLSVEAELAEIFAAADATGWVHAREVDGDREVGLRPDERVILASTFKIPVALEFFTRAAQGEFDLDAPVRVPVEGRAPGPTGISAMSGPVEMTLADLAVSMISVSDNAATDVVCDLVGLDRVQERLDRLGLGELRIPFDCRGIFATMYEDAAAAGRPLEALYAGDPTLLSSLRALDPGRTVSGTPRAMTTLLALLWRDEAGPAEACEAVRKVMGQQVWPHRLTAGFAADVALAGKTGTLPSAHNEVAVVTYPDGSRYAVAVFTRSHRYDLRQPQLDRAIGLAGRAAVEALRR
jgi:beta-lactamase class A